MLAYYCRFGKKPSSALKGKVIWITGASSGIGEDLAYQLAKCGAKLVLLARRKEELEQVAKKCSREQILTTPYSLNISRKKNFADFEVF